MVKERKMKFSSVFSRKIVHFSAKVSIPFPVLLKIPSFSIVLLFILISNNEAVSQVLNTALPITNGAVKSIVKSGDTLYLGGYFTEIGEAAGRAVLLNKISGKHDKTFPEINGSVNICLPDGHGGWYIGGSFSKVNGLSRNAIVHINADNSISSWSPSITDVNPFGEEIPGEVNTIAIKGEAVYIGGWFTKVNGIERKYAAAVNIVGDGELTDWDPKPNSGVYAIQPGDSTVFLGGTFTNLLDGLVPRNYIAEVKISNSMPTIWGPKILPISGSTVIRGMLLEKDTIYVWGTFSILNESTRWGLASIDAKTGTETTWDPLAYADQYINWSKNPIPIYDLKIKGDTVFLAGSFTYIANLSTFEILRRNRLAAVSKSVKQTPNGDFPVLYDWNPNVEGNDSTSGNAEVAVYSINLDGNNLYAAGTFDRVGTVEHQNLAVVDIHSGMVGNFTTRLASARGTGIPGLKSVSINGDNILTGGWINIVNAFHRNSVAAIKISTGEVLPWNPQFSTGFPTLSPPTINSMIKFQNEIYISGNFDRATDQAVSWMAIVDNNSGQLSPFSSTLSGGAALDMEIFNNKLFIAGGFVSGIIGDSTRHSLASYDLIEHKVTSWNPNYLQGQNYNTIYSIAIHDSILYAGGSFGHMGDKVRKTLGAANIFTGEVLSWNPTQENILAKVRTVHYADGKVFAGGGFTSINGHNRTHLAAIDPKTGNILPWVSQEIESFPSNVDGIPGLFTLASMDSILFIGGAIAKVGTYPINGLAALNINTGDVLTDFNLQLDGWPWNRPNTFIENICLDENSSSIYFGGNFMNVNGKPYSGFASYSGFLTGIKNEEELEVPGIYSLSQNYPNPFNPSTQIQFSLPEESDVKLTVYNALGKQVAVLVNDHLSSGTHSYLLNAANFASGIYFYRIETNSFNMSRKMVLIK